MDLAPFAVSMHEPTISSVQADPLIMPKDVLKELQKGFQGITESEATIGMAASPCAACITSGQHQMLFCKRKTCCRAKGVLTCCWRGHEMCLERLLPHLDLLQCWASQVTFMLFLEF